MTGLYNYRNYDYFGHLKNEAYTFGNLMKDAGYKTCIAGKWQLNGLAYKENIPYWNDSKRPYHFGFDEYCLWQLTRTRGEGERFADPLIEQNGQVLETNIDDYGPEIFTNFLLDFMERNKDLPFFIYYPMVLVHEPFVPTPDSRDWNNPSMRYKNDTTYFKDMVAYTDKKVGEIMDKLEKLELNEHTIILFTGDNGTHPSIFSHTVKGVIQGGKGNTIDAGVHVPLIAYWPEKIKKSIEYDGLIEFSDFFPTLADIAGKHSEADGKSFFPLLIGEYNEPRKTVFVHYDPGWGKLVNQHRNQFVQTVDYKLYQDGLFFNLTNDILEKYPLDTDSLDESELEIRSFLQNELSNHPAWDKAD
jgi:arylsulfatase A